MDTPIWYTVIRRAIFIVAIVSLLTASTNTAQAGVLCADADGDQICDTVDVCTNDGLNDVDGDGICAGSGFLAPKTGDHDNCPHDANASQTDTDSDGRGDACDLCPTDAGAAEDSCLGDGFWGVGASNTIQRSNSSAVAVDGIVYLIGGQQTTSVEIYDPNTDVWTTGPNVPEKRHHMQPVVIDGKIYAIGGLKTGTTPAPSANTVWMLDPANLAAGWQTLTPMPTSRGALGCAADGVLIYCAGGVSTEFAGLAVDVFEVYNTVTDTWTTLPSMPRPRDHTLAQIVNGKFYAIAGRDTLVSNLYNNTDIYDIATGVWSAGTPIPTARGGYVSVVVGGRILIFGGEGSGPYDGVYGAAEEYDPVRDSWRTLERMPSPRHGMGGPLSVAADGVHSKIYLLSGARREGGGKSNINEVFSYDLCFADSGCDDGNPCTTDTCDVSSHCVHTPVDAVTAQCPDPDNDGLAATDPCPLDPRNSCFGTVATDQTTATPVRINANVSSAECSGQKTDCNGDIWYADFGYNVAAHASTCSLGGGGEGCVIGGLVALFGCEDETTEDLFQCEHSDKATDPELDYSFDVPNGSYLLNLFFGNSAKSTQITTDRLFNVLIEGALVLDHFDQVAAAGGDFAASSKAIVRSILVDVSDGNGLQIDFVHLENNPSVKAIELLASSGIATTTTTMPPPGCVVDADCNDANACTADSCSFGVCINSDIAASCDDGNACNGVETCDTLLGCQAGTTLVCDDGNPCTDDVCNAVSGCLTINNTLPCSDGLFCNGADSCSLGSCSAHAGDPCSSGSDCADTCDETADSCLEPAGTLCATDGNLCTGDVCDGAGSCLHPTISCSDANVCNGAETCDPGLGCQAGATLNCDDGNPCTDDTCDAVLGCLNTANVAPCDDGLFCNGADTCSAGSCAVHNGDPCSGGECADACDEVADSCFDPAGAACTDDGNLCTQDVCDGAGTCSHPVISCNDANICNGAETCDPALGCQAGAALDCDDGNPCTDDTCDAALGCLNTPNVDPCDDGLFCNGADTCSAGSCTAHNGDPCSGGECADSCDEAADSCLNPAGAACTDDGNLCTQDVCDGAGACSHPVISCDDANVCNGVETCDPALGCQAGTALSCDDANLCTDDSCDQASGCVFVANTAACDDGMFCNGSDTCDAGACTAHGGDPCVAGADCMDSCDEAVDSCQAAVGAACADDGNACTLDLCDASGACTHVSVTCDDGDACNGLETCDSLVGCVLGGIPDCDDGNACTNDSCESVAGCVHAAVTCDDGNSCNGTETCDALVGCQAGTTPDCDDANVCTDDSCDAVLGCVHADNTAPCDDGAFCNGADSCAGGNCLSHTGDPCVNGAECSNVCDELADTCSDPAGTACSDDGDVCTDDRCDGSGSCAHVATPNGGEACAPTTTSTTTITTSTTSTTTSTSTTVTPGSTTTTTLVVSRCAQPLSMGPVPIASDCLYLLNAAVGLEPCDDPCVCAPKGQLPTTATDALICLLVSVGNDQQLNCPCDGLF